MRIEFCKYHGAGNDFVMIDNRHGKLRLKTDQIALLCNRHLGIGADGLIILGRSSRHDFNMRYYNSDGLEGSMCGNGARCSLAFACDLGMIRTKAVFDAIDGVHHGIITGNKSGEILSKVSMRDVTDIETAPGFYYLDTGSPHYVRFVRDVSILDVVKLGRKVRYNARFSAVGTNVNFAEITKNGLFVRTYERGVEDETLSCGTGVAAAAIAFAVKQKCSGPVRVRTLGGALSVEFTRQGATFSNIWLHGPARFVYRGSVNL